MRRWVGCVVTGALALGSALGGGLAEAATISLVRTSAAATGAEVSFDLLLDAGSTLDDSALLLLRGKNPDVKPLLGLMGGGLLVTWNTGDAAFKSMTFRSSIQVGDDPGLRAICSTDSAVVCGPFKSLLPEGRDGFVFGFGNLAGLFGAQKKIATIVLRDVLSESYRLEFDRFGILGEPLWSLFDQETGGIINLKDGSTVDPANPPEAEDYEDSARVLAEIHRNGDPLSIEVVYDPIPEPSTLLLLSSGLSILAAARRRTSALG